MGLQLKECGLLNTLEEFLYNTISINIPLGFLTISVIFAAVFFLVFHYLNKKIIPGDVLFPGLIVGKDNRLAYPRSKDSCGQ